jgi:hypothetical protein
MAGRFCPQPLEPITEAFEVLLDPVFHDVRPMLDRAQVAVYGRVGGHWISAGHQYGGVHCALARHAGLTFPVPICNS